MGCSSSATAVVFDSSLLIYLLLSYLKSSLTFWLNSFAYTAYVVIELRQYRIKIARILRSQTFRQSVRIFCRHTVVCQREFVQYDGIYASKMCAKIYYYLIESFKSENEND